MSAVLAGYRRLLAGVAILEMGVGGLLIIIIVASIGAQVFSRYLLDRPLIWVEELATYAFIWATFIGASLGLKCQRHIRIESVALWASPRLQAVLRIVTGTLVLAILMQLLPVAWTVMGVESRSRSISLPWPIPRAWFYSIPLFVGAVSMALTTLYLVLVEFAVARGHARPAPLVELPGDEPGEPGRDRLVAEPRP